MTKIVRTDSKLECPINDAALRETGADLVLLPDGVGEDDLTDAVRDGKVEAVGKRGEVKEARDRYANMEVSHLLSRIELHDGPVILTTNLRKELDQAFIRRFHIVVDFPRPDAASRSLLWRRLLPPQAPLDKSLDFAELGKAANLSGGSIRNAALHAAYLAAARDKAIGRREAALAVWRELNKENRQVARSELGSLAAQLEKEAG